MKLQETVQKEVIQLAVTYNALHCALVARTLCQMEERSHFLQQQQETRNN
ncbi:MULTISPECIES: hypothetical protein [unclassified Microcoleus]